MSLPILNDLKNELERLYIAGSALADNDPRVKKHIPGLIKLGERAPVFKNLADRLTALTQSAASSENLLEAGSMLFSLIYSQGRSDDGAGNEPIEYGAAPLIVNNIGFLELNDLLASIKPKSYNCHEKLEELYSNNRHRDPRLYKTYVMCVKQGNPQTADIAGRLIIPSLGPSVIPVIRSELNIKGGEGDARLYSVLSGLLGKDILPLSERVLEEGSQEVLAAALYTLRVDGKYNDILNKYAKDRRGIIREAAERALADR